MEWSTAIFLLLCFFSQHCYHKASEIPNDSDKKQYCPWDTFNATCGKAQIIVMESARYGRMRFGGCVKENHGHLGCSADVLSHLDRMCSGKHHCAMRMPDPALHKIHACPKELLSYLEAKYRCEKVAVAENQMCDHHVPLILSSASGYLSSLIADDRGLGSTSCPWLLRAQPGQRFKLTLLNFHHTVLAEKSTDQRGRFCESYITVKENGKYTNVTSCLGDPRTKEVYTSDKPTLEVGILPSLRHAVWPRRFLIKFEAVGCADPIPRLNAHVRRVGDTAVYKCNYTDETYFLSCDTEFNWIGDVGNCSNAASRTGKNASQSSSRFPYGILVVIGIGVALGVAMGIILLMSILICIQRRKEATMRSATTDPLLQDPNHEHDDHTLQCGCGAKVYYATRLECQMALRASQPGIPQEPLTISNMRAQPQPADGEFQDIPIGGGCDQNRALPDMCIIENENETMRDLQRINEENTENDQLQTSFITFKPQPRLSTLSCRSCAPLDQIPLRRADKSSSSLPHYGKITRNGNLEELCAEEVPLPVLCDLRRPSCTECVKENVNARERDSGNLSV